MKESITEQPSGCKGQQGLQPGLHFLRVVQRNGKQNEERCGADQQSRPERVDPDVKGIDLGFILAFWNIIVMMVVVVVMVVMMMRIIMVVSMIVVIMMIVILLLIHFIRLLRVLKTRIFIVVVVLMVVMIVIVVPRTKRRERQPQHHHEQPQRNVNPVGFRLPLAFHHGGGLSPPTFGVIHPEAIGRRKQLEGESDFCEENSPPTKIYLHVTEW